IIQESPKEMMTSNMRNKEIQTNTNPTKKKKSDREYPTNHRKLWIGPGEGCNLSLGKLKKLIYSVKFWVRISASIHPNSNKKRDKSNPSNNLNHDPIKKNHD
ncbi:hypothetical protein DFH28DRAFT_869961, partial [Melampsora americana]